MDVDKRTGDSDPEAEFNAKLKQIMDNSEVSESEPETEEEEIIEQGLQEIDVDDDAVEESEEEDVQPNTSATRRLSKEESAIVALKRELKEAKDALKTITVQKQESTTATRKEELAKRYVTEGYDQDTANFMASQEMRIMDIDKRIAVSEFKSENDALFDEYPEAKAEAGRIMDLMEKTGFSAEQVCNSLYRVGANKVQERAKAAVSGKLDRKPADNAVSSAVRSAGSTEASVALSSADRAKKTEFEKQFGIITNKRYLELKDKFGL